MTQAVIDIAVLNRCKFSEGSYLSLGTESNDWIDLCTIKEPGRLLAFHFSSGNWTSANYATRLRIVDASENSLRVIEQRIDASTPVPNVGPMWFLGGLHVEVGAKIQMNFTSTSAGARYGVHSYVMPEDDPVEPTISIFGDGEHPGDPGLVRHASICNALRRMREELEEEL